MYPVTVAFKEAVRQSHVATIRVEVWRSGEYLRTLEIVDGSIDIDARRAQRRTLSITVPATRPSISLVAVFAIYQDLIGTGTYLALSSAYGTYADMKVITGYDEVSVDDALIPTTAYSDVSPYGNEIRVWRGIEVPTGHVMNYQELSADYATYLAVDTGYATYGQMKVPTGTEIVREEVPLGVFVITDVSVTDSGAGAKMDIQGVDRSMKIAKALWLDALQIGSGANLSDAVGFILSDRWPDVPLNLQDTAQTIPATVLGLNEGSSGQDPWADAQKLATGGGMELFFDGTGTAVLRPVTDPSTATPVEVYEEGVDAVVLDVTRRLSTDTTSNGVVMSGEGSNVTPPVRAVVFDEDPASPTYRYGEFGERPVFMSSPLILTAADAVAAATAELAKLKGAEENVEWTMLCDPSMDAGDVIEIHNTGTRLNKVLVLDKLSVPLTSSGTMKAVARTIRVLESA